MRNYSILFFVGLIAPIFFSCKKEAQTPLIHHPVSAVTGPATGTTNTAVRLTVTYPYGNGCDFIGSFDKTVNGNVVSIQAYSKPVAKDVFCTQDAGFRTIEYNFLSPNTGTFDLRFINPDGSFVGHTVTIQ